MNVVVEQEDATIKGAIADYWARVKAGDIGSLPAVLGQGTLFWSKGTPRYTGDWVEGKKHGWGKQWREDESRAYQGRFENDQRTMGTSFKEDGNTIDIDGNHQPA